MRRRLAHSRFYMPWQQRWERLPHSLGTPTSVVTTHRSGQPMTCHQCFACLWHVLCGMVVHLYISPLCHLSMERPSGACPPAGVHPLSWFDRDEPRNWHLGPAPKLLYSY